MYSNSTGKEKENEDFGWDQDGVPNVNYDLTWPQPSTGAYNTPTMDYEEASQQQQENFPSQQLEQSDTLEPTGEVAKGETPYGFPERWDPNTAFAKTRWVNIPVTGEPDYGYLPMTKHLMKEFWQDAAADKEDSWFCRRWDHVDFFWLVYLTVTLVGNVSMTTTSNEDERLLQNLATIFNMASPSTQNRPPGFFRTLGNRNKQVDVPMLRQLFQILNNQQNPNRNNPLMRVMEWS
ncbi:hypothetical protein BTUL_0174g00050 [Botrytis tulipae]|uniref:Uncharacterized protein n=1 Tax=Botrytis tulipae TaxID=87230 RepID=A0A4Z1EET7_9HELO|nr:hypothetical protein BTUL_0174g00050 [Botrytis tulipae]